MRLSLASVLLAIAIFATACNVKDKTLHVDSDTGSTQPSDTGPDAEDDTGPDAEHDTGPDADIHEYDTSPDEPDSDDAKDDPIEPGELRITRARMETLRDDFTTGSITIKEHSIEGYQFTCNGGSCIRGRIIP